MTATPAPKPRLIFHSNVPWGSTGYSNQCALFTERLKDDYDLAISAFWGLEGNVVPWQGIPVLPGLGQTHGDATIHDHVRRFCNGDLRGGIVQTLLDVWVLDPAIWRQMNVLSWVPVDHEPLAPPIAHYFYESHAIPLAMSRFGETQLRDAGLDPLYCPHAVDTTVYRPQPKEKGRERLGVDENAFVVGMVAANKGNPSRKCFPEAFQAFKRLHDRHPEAVLYLHTEMFGRFNGVHIPDLVTAVGLPHSAVRYVDQYRAVHLPYPADAMAEIYSAMDVLLAPSAGEGYGIPVMEAQACGTPVIVSDFSAQPELVGAGWLVKGTKHYTPLKAWQFMPDVDDIHDALRRSYAMSPDDRAVASEKAVAHAAHYDIRHVLSEYMLPALEAAAARFAEQEPVTIPAREPLEAVA